MEDNPIDSNLLLPDLYIENFRGIKKLSIPRLGRVTLLAGRNGVGKSSVLDAISVFSARGNYNFLGVYLSRLGERLFLVDEKNQSNFEPDWSALFYGRDISEDIQVSIGSKSDVDRLTISAEFLTNKHPLIVERIAPYGILEGRIRSFTVKYRGVGYTVPLLNPNDLGKRLSVSGRSVYAAPTGSVAFEEKSRDQDLPPPRNCLAVGPDPIDNSSLSTLWKSVALTDSEIQVVESLGMMYGEVVERVSVVGEWSGNNAASEPQPIAKIRGLDRPVPLSSLGDGALRLFGVALALANSRDGFLLIDEAENGIHHSVQRDYWRMVLQTAHENNVQVFATTHSWDCVRGFAQAATENEDVEGVLVRLEKEDEGLRAVRYDERRLKIAAEQRIEVR